MHAGMASPLMPLPSQWNGLALDRLLAQRGWKTGGAVLEPICNLEHSPA